jgi:hypothetical protein
MPLKESHPRDERDMKPELGLVKFADWVRPTWARCRHIPIRTAVRASRGTARHLTHHGSLPGKWEPRSERSFAMTSKPPSLVMSRTGDGASVVVRARESRAHGEGRQ